MFTLQSPAYQYKYQPREVCKHFQKHHLHNAFDNIRSNFEILFKCRSLSESNIAERTLTRNKFSIIGINYSEVNNKIKYF